MENSPSQYLLNDRKIWCRKTPSSSDRLKMKLTNKFVENILVGQFIRLVSSLWLTLPLLLGFMPKEDCYFRKIRDILDRNIMMPKKIAKIVFSYVKTDKILKK